MTVRTIRLQEGKYEYDVDTDKGRVVDARRHGERWIAGLESVVFSHSLTALMLYTLELEDCLAKSQVFIPDSDGGTCD